MTSLTIVGIESAKEASELVLGQLPVGSITKIVAIMFNETQPFTFSKPVEIQSFFNKNQALPISYREEHDCFSMLGGAGGKLFSTVMIFVEGEPEGYTLVADLETHDSEGFPFNGRFTAGPFETIEEAHTFAVKLLVREGIAIEDRGQPEDPVCWKLKAELDPDEEWFANAADLLDAWQDCLEGLEWFHIFPVMKIPSKPAKPIASPLPS